MDQDIKRPDAPESGSQGASPGGDGQKKKDKVRSVWISFIGRIVAQIIGAIATVVLTIYIVQRYQVPPPAVTATDGTAGEGPRAVAGVRPAPGEVALAVLPLDNFSGDPAQAYFADGMTEALIADLARLEGVKVISRTSSSRYRGQQKSLPDIARELGVTHVLEGSVLRQGNRVRVTAQIIEAASDRHIFAQTYDRTASDVLELHAELATTIAREIGAAISPDLERRFTSRGAVDPDAYALYLKGRAAMALRTSEGFSDAVALFKQAAKKDPSFARAYSSLSATYTLVYRSVYNGRSAPGVIGLAATAAEQALALDSGLSEAHASLASVHHLFEWEWAAAEREFRTAVALRPGYAQAHQWLAVLLAEVGRLDEARAEAARAVALDPLSAATLRTAGLVEYFARRFDAAESAQRKALAFDQGPVTALMLASSLAEGGKAPDAVTLCEQLAPKGPLGDEIRATLGYAAARSGNLDRARAIRQELKARDVVPTLGLARLDAVLGDQASLLDVIERAAAGRLEFVTSLKADPVFDTVRSHPRFAALMVRLKL